MKVVKGSWYQQAKLQKSYENCIPVTTTVSNGNSSTIISCSTNWETIDQIDNMGLCLSDSVCDPIKPLAIPQQWTDKADGPFSSYKIADYNTYKVCFEDIELDPGKEHCFQYAMHEYQAMLPNELSNWVDIRKALLGNFRKPKFDAVIGIDQGRL